MTIRLRLTLVYSTILALTLIVFGITLYTIQSRDTLNSLERDLVQSSNNLTDSLVRTDIAIIIHEPFAVNAPPPQTFDEFSDEQSFQNLREREIVRILDSNGKLLVSPYGHEADALPLSAAALASLKNNIPSFETGVVSEENMLIYNRPIFSDGELAYILQIARSLTERNRTLSSLASTLTIAGVITTGTAFGIGWVLSGLALRPIDRITQTAHEIGEERDFTRRVEHTGKQDEVGQLANTFNQMLTRLQDAYQKVEHSLEQQRNFVSDVSHELRTPLTTLRGNLGLLKHDPPVPPEDQEDILRDMVEESDRMIRLVNELLLLAHADARRSLNNETVSVPPLIEQCVRQSGQLNAGQEIVLDIVPELTIFGDQDALKQVILILLDNAIKYTEGTIHVQAHRVRDEVAIIVKDEGPGISPEDLDHIFDRFYRVEDHTPLPGFGLGLPIAKSLVERMDGTITMQSEVGQGSTITIMLPAENIPVDD